MTESLSMQLSGFASIYLLLLIVGAIFKKCHIQQTKFLLLASLQMTVQLIIAGYVLLYIFKYPSPIFTCTYLALMIGFAIHRALNKNKWLNNKFKWITILSILIKRCFYRWIYDDCRYSKRYFHTTIYHPNQRYAGQRYHER